MKVTKRAIYEQLSKIFVMPEYSSRCITHDYLKLVSSVPVVFKITQKEWRECTANILGGYPDFNPKIPIHRSIPEVLTAINNHPNFIKRN